MNIEGRTVGSFKGNVSVSECKDFRDEFTLTIMPDKVLVVGVMDRGEWEIFLRLATRTAHIVWWYCFISFLASKVTSNCTPTLRASAPHTPGNDK